MNSVPVACLVIFLTFVSSDLFAQVREVGPASDRVTKQDLDHVIQSVNEATFRNSTRMEILMNKRLRENVELYNNVEKRLTATFVVGTLLFAISICGIAIAILFSVKKSLAHFERKALALAHKTIIRYERNRTVHLTEYISSIAQKLEGMTSSQMEDIRVLLADMFIGTDLLARVVFVDKKVDYSTLLQVVMGNPILRRRWSITKEVEVPSAIELSFKREGVGSGKFNLTAILRTSKDDSYAVFDEASEKIVKLDNTLSFAIGLSKERVKRESESQLKSNPSTRVN